MVVDGVAARRRAGVRVVSHGSLAASGAAAGAAVVSVACAIAAAVVHRGAVARGDVPVSLMAADVVLALAFPVVGAVIVAHQSVSRVGWLLLTTSLMGPYLLAGQYAALSSVSPHWGGAVAAWVAVWGYQPYFVLWALVPMHFPDGNLPSDRWRPLRTAVIGLIAISTAARMFAPIRADVATSVRNPLGIAGAEWLNAVTLAASLALVVAGGIGGVVAVVTRLRGAAGVERRRLQWLVLGATWLLLCNIVGALLDGHGEVSDAAFAAGMIGLVAAVAVGAIRHQLFDVGTALSRTIVYVALTVLLAVAAAAVIAAAGDLAPGRRTALVVVAIVALVAAGTRDQLQRLVDRALFGRPQDPYAVLSTLQRRIDGAAGPLDALAQLVAALRDTLVLPYVAVQAEDPRTPPIATGSPSPTAEDVGIVEGGQRVGSLLVGRRTPTARFTKRERRALSDAAARAGELLRRAELVNELQGQHHRLVLAREEERRRLRRDLHDGVGPALAAVAMQLDRLATDLQADARLAEQATKARDHLRDTVATVRDVVDGLRPSTLDDIGLYDAIGELVNSYAPTARLDGGDLPALPAAVEAAAYFIAGEGLTNAMRHSHCSDCVVGVAVEQGRLVVTITDNGRGLNGDPITGVGIDSMRERAAEVGGRFEIVSGSGTTTVRASLPLGQLR